MGCARHNVDRRDRALRGPVSHRMAHGVAEQRGRLRARRRRLQNALAAQDLMDTSVTSRIARLDWARIRAGLDERGYATTEPLLTPSECAGIIALYPRIAPVANEWTKAMGGRALFPPTLNDFLEVCHRAGQTKPTPLILRYEAGGYNCMHQDIYGEVVFPIQLTCVLSRNIEDYRGGEFVLMEQRPRAQSRCEAVTLEQGEAIIFTTRYRPVRGTRGYYRVNVRHGVSRLHSGRRFSLGIIFHDAK